MAVQAGLCLAWLETPEDTFCDVVAHIYYFHIPEMTGQDQVLLVGVKMKEDPKRNLQGMHFWAFVFMAICKFEMFQYYFFIIVTHTFWMHMSNATEKPVYALCKHQWCRYLCSLISALIVRCLDSIMPSLANSKFSYL